MIAVLGSWVDDLHHGHGLIFARFLEEGDFRACGAKIALCAGHPYNRPMRCLLVALLIVLSATPPARAQTIGLPRLDSVNFFVEAGDFESKEAVDLQHPGVYGWGFETGFTVASSDTHVLELALGYDQFLEHARFGDGAVLTGELPRPAEHLDLRDVRE